MATDINIAKDIYDLLSTQGFDVAVADPRGNDVQPEDGRIFKFDWVSKTGKNYGTAVIVVGEENELQLFFGDNLGKGMEEPDKTQWFDFLQQLRQFSTRHGFHTFSPKNLSSLRHALTGLAAVKEGLFENYYGTRKVSYMGEPTDARLVIKHNRILGENDRRYRYIESLFIETADDQRFKLPFRNLVGGRAMLEHVRNGGTPFDSRGQHISEMVNEINVLTRFNRASKVQVVEESTASMVEMAKKYLGTLQENLRHISHTRGYTTYFENWQPNEVSDVQELAENIKNLFLVTSIDHRIEQALPTLAKLKQQEEKMKEAAIFESWIERLAEGTWSLPDTPEQHEKLRTLMSKELIVGPDAINATEQLYDLVGDDKLFDRLSDLAKQDARANIWDDSEVMSRLQELGIDVSSAGQQPDNNQDVNPGEVEQPQNAQPEDDVKESNLPSITSSGTHPTASSPAQMARTLGNMAAKEPGGGSRFDQQAMVHEQGSDMTDAERAHIRSQIPAAQRKEKYGKDFVSQQQQDTAMAKKRAHSGPEGMADLQQRLGIAERAELRRIAELAQVPVKESVLKDEQRETLTHILDRFKHEVKKFEQGGDLDDDLYHTLYDYYFDMGDMPYGTAKYRTGDPYEWVTQRLADELGITESNSGMIMPEADPMDTFEVMSGFDAPVAEGSCNMTAEGEYCPEHGLAECGYMESMGGTVAGSVAPAMDAMDEAMFPGSKIGDKLRSMKQGIGQHADSIKLGLASMPGAAAGASAGAAMGAANLGSAGGSAAALFAPALGTGLLAGAAGALGGFLTYKGLNWLAQKLFGTTEEALEFAKAHLRAAGAGRPSFEFQGKTYPVKIKNEQEINQLLDKIKTLQMHTTEATEDPINRNDAITGSYYESRESDALLARIKSLALLK